MNNQVGESELIERERPDNLQVQDNIVQPWSIVQKSLRLTIPKSIQSQPVSYSRSDIRPVSSDIRPVTPSKNELKREVDNCTPPTQAITVNTGFQQINAISQPGAFLTSVIHVPGGSQMGSFVGIDSKSAYVWKGGKRNQTMSLGRDVHSSIQSPLMGLTAWIYIPKSRIYLLANKQLQLKILDFNFDYLSHESTEKQALCLEYIESLDEVVVGGAKYVSVFKLLKSTIKGKIVTSFTGPRLIINDFTGDEWVSKTVVHVLSDRLFVVCGSCVYVYNYKTGERLASMKDIHILSITSILFYNKIEYFITASKDSVIKVWNNTYKIVHELRGHSQAVTSLVKPDFNGFSQGDSYLMSCSLDGKLNMWNIENGQLISSFDALDECVGMGFIKRDIFYIHSKDGICTYTMTRAWSSFSRFNSIQLTRHENRDAAARILSMSSDGSLRLLSPLTGALLITGMPIMRDLDPNASVYSFSKGIFF